MKTNTNKRRRQLDLSPEQIEASKQKKETLRKLATSVREMGTIALQHEAMKLGAIERVAGGYLSPFNSAFVRRQKVTATQVGGFEQWKKAGRKVKKGSKAVSIWLPMRKDDKSEETGEVNELTFFRLVNVFDVSDTEPLNA